VDVADQNFFHNRAISEVAKNYKPRKLPDAVRPKMWLSGLVDVIVDDLYNHLGLPFLNVGERCNISESIRFKKLMMKGDYAKANVLREETGRRRSTHA
jgi:5-methyltetrahydrofolate--homocysteine methyltransferase